MSTLGRPTAGHRPSLAMRWSPRTGCGTTVCLRTVDTALAHVAGVENATAADDAFNLFEWRSGTAISQERVGMVVASQLPLHVNRESHVRWKGRASPTSKAAHDALLLFKTIACPHRIVLTTCAVTNTNRPPRSAPWDPAYDF